jgi:enoyl-CoA hydratase/carnithine racemase
MSEFEAIEYSVRDHVAWITLNRPQVHNAINATMRSELGRAWQMVKSDHDVHVAVITGAGERAFTTGADRGGMSNDDASADASNVGMAIAAGVVPGSPGYESDLEHTIAPKSAGCWKPVIAAINGIACGGAFYILGEADILIAAEHATFFDPHVTFGMVSAYESMHMLMRMPLGEVLRMQLSGSSERLSAQRAHQIGLVSEVVPQDELLAAAGRVAANIAQHSPNAVQGTLRAIWAALDNSRPAALNLSPHFIGMASLDDWKAGQDKFAAGGRPEWTVR